MNTIEITTSPYDFVINGLSLTGNGFIYTGILNITHLTILNKNSSTRKLAVNNTNQTAWEFTPSITLPTDILKMNETKKSWVLGVDSFRNNSASFNYSNLKPETHYRLYAIGSSELPNIHSTKWTDIIIKDVWTTSVKVTSGRSLSFSFIMILLFVLNY